MPVNVEFSVRSPFPSETVAIFALIQALAEYEKLSHKITGTVEQLEIDLFSDRPSIEALVAVDPQSKVLGFALFFLNYSTFLTKSGIYLEDIFVLPEYRGAGIGKSLLLQVAKLANSRGYGRLEWSVLDWNQSAIKFYEALGAKVLPDWRICRVNEEDLARFAHQ